MNSFSSWLLVLSAAAIGACGGSTFTGGGADGGSGTSGASSGGSGATGGGTGGSGATGTGGSGAVGTGGSGGVGTGGTGATGSGGTGATGTGGAGNAGGVGGTGNVGGSGGSGGCVDTTCGPDGAACCNEGTGCATTGGSGTSCSCTNGHWVCTTSGSGGAGGAPGTCNVSSDCGFGFDCCGGRCVNLQNDIHNCGHCGTACPGDHPFCGNGTCGVPPCTITPDPQPPSFCCGTSICNGNQLCCVVDGPGPTGGPTCFTPTSAQNTCPLGCPLCG